MRTRAASRSSKALSNSGRAKPASAACACRGRPSTAWTKAPPRLALHARAGTGPHSPRAAARRAKPRRVPLRARRAEDRGQLRHPRQDERDGRSRPLGAAAGGAERAARARAREDSVGAYESSRQRVLVACSASPHSALSPACRACLHSACEWSGAVLTQAEDTPDNASNLTQNTQPTCGLETWSRQTHCATREYRLR